ncbi:hypothetical protein B296_00034770 [Ensete ventricosum]|uniref:Uncharacterized protein n=1 Tax=Ensete ventricosum TaxID=4639 RepID=A0A426XIR3_ENSVE|nr:hypothetical protein B296_00034770 [Ensete ventricosum]
MTVINFAQSHAQSRVSIDFLCTCQKFKILAIAKLLAHGKSYKHGFAKKCDGHKVARKVEFRSIFHASSRKFKILAIRNVLAHGKSYEHGFAKKHQGHKFSIMSSFDQFYMHHPENSKYWSFPIY